MRHPRVRARRAFRAFAAPPVFGTFLLAALAGGPHAASASAAGPASGTAHAAVSGPHAAARADTASRPRVARRVATDTAHVELGGPGSGAFVAYPPGAGPAPGVVIVHEWWGLNAQIREVARRLARQGYVAVVPDLYGGRVAADAEGAHVLARGLDEDEALSRIGAAVAWLAGEPRVAKRRRALLGFCMGGRLALREALRDPSLSAVVLYYGAPESRADRLAPLSVPLLGHFGAEDQGIAVERVGAFESTLRGAGKVAEIHVYAGAGHAFANEEGEGYRPEAARLAWVRTLDFLQKHVKGKP